jgi:hypothetical protein
MAATTNVNAFTTKEQVLAALASGQMTVDAASAWLSAHSGNGHSNGISLKVSEKGAVSIRGIKGVSVKFGLTLYAAALEDLFANKDKIEAFIKANNPKLSRK